MDMVNLRVENVRLLVCTHAHSDHVGQAKPIVERAGCELWLHPRHEHLTRTAFDPDAALRAPPRGRPDLAASRPRRSTPTASAARAATTASRGSSSPPAISSTASRCPPTSATWRVVETPGHAPSHVCLWQPERRLLISGDHLLGRVSPYYDYGWYADPAGRVPGLAGPVEDLDARLCLSGHGRTFSDVAGHIAANRTLVHERIARVLDVVTYDGPLTAFEAVPRVFGEPLTPLNANWWISETLCYLRHLEVTGRVAREPGEGGVEAWRAA